MAGRKPAILNMEEQKMENKHIKKVTPNRDINGILYFLTRGIRNIFGNNLIGIYLTGSLSYGDFDEGRSDIDLAVILKKLASAEEIELLKQIHSNAEYKYKKWTKRVECSYIPLDMLQNILPSKTPRPYVGGGVFYPDALYGNEWLINQYFLYEYGIALIGPDFKTLVKPINIADVRKANVRDLFEEWEPKVRDSKYLADSHQQSYVVLNLCRILSSLTDLPVSKRVAVSWAKKEYPQWKNLIETADHWRYGVEMKKQKEVVEFIEFAINEVKKMNFRESTLKIKQRNKRFKSKTNTQHKRKNKLDKYKISDKMYLETKR